MWHMMIPFSCFFEYFCLPPEMFSHNIIANASMVQRMCRMVQKYTVSPSSAGKRHLVADRRQRRMTKLDWQSYTETNLTNFYICGRTQHTMMQMDYNIRRLTQVPLPSARNRKDKIGRDSQNNGVAGDPVAFYVNWDHKVFLLNWLVSVYTQTL